MADPSLVAFTFTLGAFAFFSPCGLPMLPAYLAYYLPRAEGVEGSAPRDALRGLAGGGLAALGAFAVIAGIGVLARVLGSPFKARVIHLEAVGGLVLLALGILTLTGRGPSVRFALKPRDKRGALGILSFGALYAIAGASCVAPLFIGVLVLAETSSLADGVLLVLAYAAGFALLLVGTTVLVTTGQRWVVQAMKKVLPHVERLSGLVLVGVGLWLLLYWATQVG